MTKRLGIVLAVLLAASLPLMAAPAESGDDGLKGAVAADAERPQVPASSFWGMLVTSVLVLGASTAALLGGGITPRMLFERKAPPPAQTAPAPEAQPRLERESETQREERAVRHSPKNKSKRSFARQGERDRSARNGWSASRRGVPHPGSRRRGGPGCRGVR